MLRNLKQKTQQIITRFSQKPNPLKLSGFSIFQKNNAPSTEKFNSSEWILNSGKNVYEKVKNLVETPKRLKRKGKIYLTIFLALFLLYLLRPYVALLNVILKKQNEK